MTNRHLLAGLVGLSALTGVLCLLAVFRENANAVGLADLRRDLKAARQEAEDEAGKLRKSLDVVSNSLAATTSALAETRTALSSEAAAHAKTRTRLDEEAKSLGEAKKRLSEAEQADKMLRNDLQAVKKRLEKAEKRLPTPKPKPNS